MQDRIILSGICGVTLYMLGRIDWLFLLFFTCMAMDYVSGTFVAIKKKNWKARRAASGIWKKVGSMFAVASGAVLDLMVFFLDEKLELIGLYNHDKPLFCTLVLIWYIITEIGSILANAGKLGAPVPKFLLSDLDLIKSKVENRKHSSEDTKNRK